MRQEQRGVGRGDAILIEAISGGEIIIPGGDFLLRAEFVRSGGDLLLTDGETTVVIRGYFELDGPPPLLTEGGAMLSPELVARLVGPLAPAQYAQAGGPAGANAIGEVKEAAGSVTVTRANGVAESLSEGAPVFLGDVLQTGPGGRVGIVFSDGTVFSLTSNARMTLDELVYDPRGSSNHLAVSVLQGTFVFLTGKVAPTGGMDVTTPVGRLGVRGTTVAVELRLEGEQSTITLMPDADGGVGRVIYTNAAGEQVLNQPFQSLQTTSNFIPPQPPIVLSGPQIDALFGSAQNLLSTMLSRPDVQQERASQGLGPGGQQQNQPSDQQQDGDQQQQQQDGQGGEQRGDAETPTQQADAPTEAEIAALAEIAPAAGDPATGEQIGPPDSFGQIERADAGADFDSSLTPPGSTLGATAGPGASDPFSTGSLPPPDPAVPGGGPGDTDPITDPLLAQSAPPLEQQPAPQEPPASPPPPLANDVAAATDESNPAQGQLLASPSLSVAAVNAQPGNVGQPITLAGGGLLTIQANGSYSFDPNQAYLELAAGQSVTETVSYTVADGQGGTTTANLSLTVNGLTPDIDGTAGDDELAGGEGDENIRGFEGNDTLLGNGGPDTLDGGPGNDVVDGGAGDDMLHGGSGEGDDQLIGGSGFDTVSYASADEPVAVDLEAGTASGDPDIGVDALSGVERVIGGAAGDALAGSGADETLEGGDGDDVLTGRGGDDAIGGGGGEDVAVYRGAVGEYQVSVAGGLAVVAHVAPSGADDGTDALTDVEVLRFSDVDVFLDGRNNAPRAAADEAAATEDGPRVVDVRANDTEFDADPLTVTGIDGQAIAPGQTVAAAGGLLTLQPDGTLRFDPNGAYETLQAGQSVEQTIAYTIADGRGGTSTASLKITIVGANDAPALDLDADDSSGGAGADFRAGARAGAPTLSPLADADLALADVDDAILQGATLTLANQPDGADESLTVDEALAASRGVAAVAYDSATGVLRLSGAASAADYADILRSARYVNASGATAGERTVEVAVSDAQGSKAVATARIELTANAAPVAGNDAAATNEDAAPIAGDVLANDADAESDPLTVTEVDGNPDSVGQQITLAGGGLLTLEADGAFSFDPNGAYEHLGVGEQAVETAAYTVSDGRGGTALANLTITLEGRNDGPAAADNAAQTNADSALAGDVLANDVDVDGDALSVAEVDGQAANVGQPIALTGGGLLTLNDGGSFLFDPNGAYDHLGAGEQAVETVSYTISDGQGGADEAELAIRIDGVNDAPEVDDDLVATGEDAAPVAGDVLANDADADGDALSVSAVNGQAASVGQQIALAGGGLLTLQADGSFTFDTNDAYEHLGVGDEAVETVGYSVSDGAGGGASATLTIRVAGANDQPAALALGNFGVAENAAGATIGALTVTDPDAGDGHAFSVDDARFEVAGGELRLKASESLDREAEPTVTVTVTATDAGGLSIAQAFEVSVTNVNEAPTAADDFYTAIEDAPLVVAGPGLLANDADPDAGDTLTAVAASGATALGGSFTVGADGGFTYAAPESLAEGEVATDSFSYSVVDRDGASHSAQVSIEAAGVNDAAMLDLDADDSSGAGGRDYAGSVAAGAGSSIAVADADLALADVDGATLASATLTLSERPDGPAEGLGVDEALAASLGISVIAYVPDAGVLQLTGAASLADYAAVLRTARYFNESPGGTDGLRTIEVAVTDAAGANAAAVARITVSEAANIAPIAADDAATADEDAAPVTGDVLANDSDANGDALQVVTVNGQAANVGQQIALAGGGLLTLQADGSFAFNPNDAYEQLGAGEQATETAAYTVSDGRGGTDTANLTVTIGGANDAPTALTLDNFSVTENAADAVIGTLTATDPDAGDAHIFTVDDPRFEVVGGQLKLKAGESLDREAEPSVSVAVTATDAGGLSVTQAFEISITNANDAPTALALDNSSVAENASGAVIGTLTVTDPDAGDNHTLAVDDARFEAAGGQLRLKAGESLDREAQPTVSVTVTATDAGGLSVAQGFEIAVTNVNEVPTALALGNASVAENAAGAVVGGVTVTDPDVGDSHVFSVDDARFEVVGGQLKLKAGQSLDRETEPTVSVTITATDAGGLSAAQTFEIGATNVNEAPLTLTLGNSSVAENAAGAVVGTLTVSDPDAGDSHVFAVDDARFEVIGGELRLKAGESLDREAEPTVAVSVTATDAGGLSVTQAFEVAVTNVNEGPTALALDNANLAENAAGAAVGAVIVTDADAGDSHTFAVDDARFEVAGGQLRLKAGESLNHEAESTVAVTVTATDAGGLSIARAFAISVTNANERPTALALDGLSVAENAAGAVVGALSVTDPDAGDSHTFAVDDSRFEVAGGQLKLKAGESLDREAEPTVTVMVTATDAGGLSLAQAFEVSVTNVNEAPAALILDNAGVGENAAGAVVGTLTASDPDAGDSHAFSVDDSRFEVADDQLRLKAGESLDHEAEPTVTVTVTASDTGGLSFAQAFEIAVADVDEAPMAAADVYVATEDAPLVVSAPGVLGNDTDPDAGDVLSALPANGATALGGSFSIAADGGFSYVAPDSLVEGQVASDSFSYTVTDEGGLTHSAQISIDVTGVNDAATLDLDADDSSGAPGSGFATFLQTGAGASAIVADADLVIADVDGAVLASAMLTLNERPDGASEGLGVDEALAANLGVAVGGYNPGTGVLQLTGAAPLADYAAVLRTARYFNGRPDATEGQRTIAFALNDGASDSALAVATVAVSADPNQAPAAAADAVEGSEDAALVIAPLANDSDPDGDPLSLQSFTQPAHGQVLRTADGKLVYAPDPGFSGTDQFDYTTSDGAAGAVASVTVQIAAVADLPTLQASAAVAGLEDQAIALNVAAALNDLDGSETMSAVTIRVLTGAGALNAGTEVSPGLWNVPLAGLPGLTFTPSAGFSGDVALEVTVAATEAEGPSRTAIERIAFEVQPQADPPSLTVQDAAGNEDAGSIALTISATINDPDGSERIAGYTVQFNPAAGALNMGVETAPGIWSLRPEDLARLRFLPADDSSGTVDLTATAAVEEADGSMASSPPAVIHLSVAPQADGAVIQGPYSATSAGAALADLNLAVTPKDPSEIVEQITIAFDGGPAQIVSEAQLAAYVADIGANATPNYQTTLVVEVTTRDGVGGPTSVATHTIDLLFNATGDGLVESSGDANSPGTLVNGGFVGAGGAGALSVRFGGELVATQPIFIGSAPGGSGSVLVSGNGSQLAVDNGFLSLEIGHASQGLLEIEDGALVQTSVNGFTPIGNFAGASGVVRVRNGGRFETGGFLSIANGAFAVLAFDGYTQGAYGATTYGELHVEAGGEAIVGGDMSVGGGHPSLLHSSRATGLVRVTGEGAHLNVNGGGFANVGDRGAGTLEVLDGGFAELGNVNVGGNRSGVGTVLVDGRGSHLALSGEFELGQLGRGSLTVSGGALLTSTDAALPIGNGAGASGALTVAGADSALLASGSLIVGNGFSNPDGSFGIPNAWTTGTATVSGGGYLRATGMTIGQEANASGAVTVTGADSLLELSNFLNIGFRGQGRLEIQDGAQVVAPFTQVGHQPGSFGAIAVSGGGELHIRSDQSFGPGGASQASLIVGSLGTGRMDVTGGSLVQIEGIGGAPFPNLGVGRSTTNPAHSVGVVNVSGAGSRIEMEGNTPNIDVGRGGVGVLNVTTGGSVFGAVFSSVGRDGGRGELNVNNGSFGLEGVGGPGSGDEGTGAFMNVGRSRGLGAVLVSNGGDVEIDGRSGFTPGAQFGRDLGSSGRLSIDGEGSSFTLRGDQGGGHAAFITVGREGFGRLAVTNGGDLTLSGEGPTGETNLLLGNFGTTGGAGMATVSGAGSTVTLTGDDPFVVVGNSARGVGEFVLSGGAALSAFGVSIAQSHGSAGLFYVDGADTQATLSGDDLGNGGALLVGLGGAGKFEASNGAAVELAAAPETVNTRGFVLGGGSLAITPGAGGGSISGGASLTVTGPFADIVVGATGAGRLDVEDSGAAVVDPDGHGAITIGQERGGVGAVTLDAGTLSANGFISVGAGLSLGLASNLGLSASHGVGGLFLEGGTAAAPDIFVGAGGVIAGQGALEGDIELQGGALAVDGVAVAGDLLLNGGVLNFIIEAAPGGPPPLTVSGFGALGAGVVHVRFAQGFLPQAGEQFTLLTASGHDAALSPDLLFLVDGIANAVRGVDYEIEWAGDTLTYVALTDGQPAGAPGPVLPANTAPTLTLPAAPGVLEDGGAVGFGAFDLGDAETPAGAPIQATLTVSFGALSLGATGGITFINGDGAGDRTMTIRGAEVDVEAALASLQYAPNTDFGGTETLRVTLDDLAQGASGASLRTTQNLSFAVAPEADAATLALIGDMLPSAPEGGRIRFNTLPRSTDADGSEQVSVRLAGVPAGASLSAGTDLGGGEWSVPLAALRGLTINPPPDLVGEFELDLIVTVQDGGDTLTMAPIPLTFRVDAVVDQPDVASPLFVSGGVGAAISLPIAATPHNGPETISSVTVAGAPASWIFTDSFGATFTGLASYDFTAAQVANLTVTPDAAGDAAGEVLTVTVTASHNGVNASRMTEVVVLAAQPDGVFESGEVFPGTYTSIGAGGVGAVQVLGTAAQAYDNLLVGNLGSAQGALTVSGPGALVQVAGSAFAGNNGDGVLSVRAGASLEVVESLAIAQNGGSNGLAEVFAGGSVTADALMVGNGFSDPLFGQPGAATNGGLAISAGGQVSARTVTFGGNAAATGIGVVSGGGAQLLVGGDGFTQLTVGSQGSGELRVEDGALVQTESLGVANLPGSAGKVVIDGRSSLLSVTETGPNTDIGSSGEAEFYVQNGGRFATASNFTFVANGDGSSGLVEVTGVGSRFETKNLVIGGGNSTFPGFGVKGETAEGTLLVTDHGTVITAQGATVGNDLRGVGEVTVDGPGSLWSVGGFFNIADRGVGEVSITGGGVISAASNVSLGSREEGYGILTVSGFGSVFEVVTPTTFASGFSRAFIEVGGNGRGRLDVLDEGAVVIHGFGGPSPGINVGGGSTTTGSGVVNVSGGSLSITGNGAFINVGRGTNGYGELSVTDGGIIETTFISLARGPDSIGRAVVDGAGSRIVLTGTDEFNNAPNIFVGRDGVGSLDVRNGGQLLIDGDLATPFANLQIGGRGNSPTTDVGDGYVMVTGEGSAITVQGDNALTYVGRNGHGQLTISNGGDVIAGRYMEIGRLANSHGSVTVSGVGSTLSLLGVAGPGSADDGNPAFLQIGREGSGFVEVLAGGQIRIDGTGGYANSAGINLGGSGGLAGGMGTLNVSGAGSLVSITGDPFSFIGVGRNGLGQLNVTAGGVVEGATFLAVGFANSVGEVTVSGVGSELRLTGVAGPGSIGSSGDISGNGAFMTVGRDGTGVVRVLDGGKILMDPASPIPGTDYSAGFSVGGNGGAIDGVGVLTVDGAGSEIRVRGEFTEFDVGFNGVGSLFVSNGGHVILENPDGEARGLIGVTEGAAGSVSVSGAGSLLDAGALLGLGVNGDLADAGIGALSVSDGGQAVADLVHLGLGGSIRGNGTVAGDVFAAGGTLLPGVGVGELSILGNLTMSGGVIEFQIGGADFHDTLSVAGALNLQATSIHVSFIEGFLPTDGMAFDLIDFGELAAAEVTFSFLGVAPGFDVAIQAAAPGQAGVLSISALGDANAGDDRLEGSIAADTLRGGAGDDELYGFAGDDTLAGGSGADAAAGGAGADTFHFDAPADGAFVAGNTPVSASGAFADILLDFTAIEGDRITLEADAFGLDHLDASNFVLIGAEYDGTNVANSGHEAGEATVVFDGASNLIYDANGAAAGYTILAQVPNGALDHTQVQLAA